MCSAISIRQKDCLTHNLSQILSHELHDRSRSRKENKRHNTQIVLCYIRQEVYYIWRNCGKSLSLRNFCTVAFKYCANQSHTQLQKQHFFRLVPHHIRQPGINDMFLTNEVEEKVLRVALLLLSQKGNNTSIKRATKTQRMLHGNDGIVVF